MDHVSPDRGGARAPGIAGSTVRAPVTLRFAPGGCALAGAAIFLLLFSLPLAAREREPNSVYAGRRAALTAKLPASVVLFRFTAHENSSPSYSCNQQENFYYRTGHNQEGAAILLLPPAAAQRNWKGPREILFLQQRDAEQERWRGPRMAPDDLGIAAKTGFE